MQNIQNNSLHVLPSEALKPLNYCHKSLKFEVSEVEIFYWKYLTISVIMKGKLFCMICIQLAPFLQKADLIQRIAGRMCHRGRQDPHKTYVLTLFLKTGSPLKHIKTRAYSKWEKV